jgi:hypothetical protein
MEEAAIKAMFISVTSSGAPFMVRHREKSTVTAGVKKLTVNHLP